MYAEPIDIQALERQHARQDPEERYDEIDISELHDNSANDPSIKAKSHKSNALQNNYHLRSSQFLKSISKHDIDSIRTLFRETANRIFEQYDSDHSGWLDREELAYLLEQLGLHGSHSLVDKLLSIYDSDNSGRIEEEEFISFLLEIKKSMEKDSFYHSYHRYLYSTADPANSQVKFKLIDPDAENPQDPSNYEFTGPKAVPYVPPSEGRMLITVDARVNVIPSAKNSLTIRSGLTWMKLLD
jgi:Ca2+-binding EF-hand superfamily protein